MGCGRGRERGGFTLLEVMIAAVVLVIAILGCFSMILTVQRHNETNNEVRLLYQASQEVLEPILHSFEQAVLLRRVGEWENTWRSGTFAVPHLTRMMRKSAVEAESPECYIGKFRVTDLRPNGESRRLYEIVVSVDSKGMTQQPQSFSIVSRRAVP